MLASFKPPVFADPADLTLGELMGAIAPYSDRPLVFHYDGRTVKPGYHVTEVKSGRFAALDCGANPESWSEIFVQLWDVVGSERTHMPAGRFAKIIGKVSEHVGLDSGTKLTFEVSDGVTPLQLHRASAPVIEDDLVHVALSPRPSSCKPRDRWLDEQGRSEPCGSKRAEACCR
jgi:hypothetical protein